MRAPAALMLVALAGTACAGELRTKIIYSTRAAELQPVLAPLAAPDGEVGVYRDQLVIRATPEKLAEIRAVLEKLDRPLKNLRISVRRQHSGSESGSGVAGRGRVIARDGKVGGRVDVQAGQRQENSRGEQRYSLTAQEGDTVFIASGSDIPVLTVLGTQRGEIIAGPVYVPAQSGFQVTPQLQPDGKVLLDIVFRHADSSGPGIHREETNTRFTARLGEWTPLSAIVRSETAESRGLSGRAEHRAQSSTPLEILVEELP